LNWQRIKNFINSDSFDDNFIVQNCLDNIEYLKDDCKIERKWNLFLNQEDKTELKRKIYDLLNH
jgi:hypothetical protein